MMKTSLKNRLVDFLSDHPKELAEIYSAFSEETPNTIRGRLNENIGKVFKRIGRGVYLATNGEAKALIIEGDAWEVIQEFENNSIDAIITDSGYTSLNKHYSVGSTRQRNRDKSIGFDTKDIDSPLLKEMYRVLKVGGHFFSFLPADAKDTLKNNNEFIALASDAGFEFNKRFIWNKVNMACGYNGRNVYEQIIFMSKGKRRMPLDLSIKDLLTHKKLSPQQKIHLAEKPIELISDLIRFSTKKGEVILDPFAGSLTLAEAGMELGVNTISIDLNGEMLKESLNKRNYTEVVGE